MVHFFPPDEVRLREHLVSQLGSMCDADPEALADYVLALLKHDKPVPELRAFCAAQLVDFLHNSKASEFYSFMLLETDSFLDSIFAFITAVSSNQSPKMPEDPQTKNGAEEPREVEEEDDEEEDEEYRRGRRHRRDRERSPNARQRSRSGSQGYNRRDYHHSHHERDYRSDHSSTAQRPPRICHQFLSRGSCDRGSSCRYEHPASPLNFIPPLINPHDAALIAAAVANGGVIPFNPRSHNVDRRRRGYHHHQFSTSRPTLSSTRLILDKIPPDCCNVAKINEYFGKFGNLVNLSVQADQNRALLQYEKPEEALAAFRSPEVIFDNRFVKLFWDANDTGAAVRPRSWNAEGASKLQEVKAIPHVQPQDEQHLRKQEVLRSMHEFQRQKQDLLQKYIQQQKDLLQRLEAGNLDDTARQELLTSLKSIDSVIGSIQVSIQAKPTATAESSSNNTAVTQTSAPILRGGPGFYRYYQQQQAPFKPRPIQSYRLDLRPTSLCLKPIPAQVGRDLGSLRKFFEPYGEIRTLVLGEDGQSAIVTYANRHLAEKALHFISKVEINEPFTIDWYVQGTKLPATETPPLLLDEDEMTDGPQSRSEDHHLAGAEEERSWKR